MLPFYIIAAVVTCIGLYLWVKQHSIVWWEAIVGALLAFLLAGVAHFAAFKGMTHDKETFSGQAVRVIFHPWWKDRVRHTRTVTHGSGKNSYTTTETYYTETEHDPYWECVGAFGSYLPSREFKISKNFHDVLSRDFGGNVKAVRGHRPDFDEGDRNDYVTDNETGIFVPMNTWVSFENRIKAGPSLYDFATVPEGVPVLPYPKNKNPFQSDRLLGTAKQTVSLLEWDRMNSRVGSKRKANVILVGFGPDSDNIMGQYQQAAWLGGKKNDLVICYGGGTPHKPQWAYTFGWTDKEIVKANLNSLLLEGPVDSTIIPKIEEEIHANYQIKEWDDFNYLSVEPPGWVIWVYLLVVILVQGGYYTWAALNKFDEDSPHGRRRNFGSVGRRVKFPKVGFSPRRRRW